MIMKKIVLFVFKAIQKLLFIQWTGYDLNFISSYKAVATWWSNLKLS